MAIDKDRQRLGDRFTAIALEARAALTPAGPAREALEQHAFDLRMFGQRVPTFVQEDDKPQR
jgi:hypothetical protein